MKYKYYQMPRSIERKYRRAIDRLLLRLMAQIRLAKTAAAALAAIRHFARSPTYREAAYDIARSMATQLAVQSQRTWRQAAAKGSKGRRIYQALKKELGNTKVYHEIIRSNASYISSVPESIADRLTQRVARGYEAGARPEALLDDILQAWPQMSSAQAKLIARTETSKASTALTRSRCAAAGLRWYVWRNSEDERVRSSHSHMGGVIVSWDEPPSPERLDPKHEQKPYGTYHAGDTFNCRCYPQPLLDFSDVSWPHKVFHKGRLRFMTLAEFKQINGGAL